MYHPPSSSSSPLPSRSPPGFDGPPPTSFGSRPSLPHSRSLPATHLQQNDSAPSSPYYAAMSSEQWNGSVDFGMSWREEGGGGASWAGEGYGGAGRSPLGEGDGPDWDPHHQSSRLPSSSSTQPSHPYASSSFVSAYRSYDDPLASSLLWQDDFSLSSATSVDAEAFQSSYLAPRQAHLPSSHAQTQPPLHLHHHPLSPQAQSYSHHDHSPHPSNLNNNRRASQPEPRYASQTYATSSISRPSPLQPLPSTEIARRGSLPSDKAPESHLTYHEGPQHPRGAQETLTRQQSSSSASDANLRRGSLPEGLATRPPSSVYPAVHTFHPNQNQPLFQTDTFDREPSQSRSFGARRVPLNRSTSDSSATSNGPHLSPNNQSPGERNLPSSLSALSVQSPTSMGYASLHGGGGGGGGGGGLAYQTSSNSSSPSALRFPVVQEEEEVQMRMEGFDGDWKQASPSSHQQQAPDTRRPTSSSASTSSSSSAPRHGHWPAPITTSDLRGRAFSISTASSSSSSGISTPNYHLSPGVASNSALHSVPSVIYSFTASDEQQDYHSQQQQQFSIVNALTPLPSDPSSTTFRTRAKRSASAPGPSLLSIGETSSSQSVLPNATEAMTAHAPVDSPAIRHVDPELVLGQCQPSNDERDLVGDELKAASDSEDEEMREQSSVGNDGDDQADESFEAASSPSPSENQAPVVRRTRSGSRLSMNGSTSARPTPARKRSNSNPGGLVQNFVTRLWAMANDPESRPFADWSEDGKSIVVPEPEAFAAVILMRHWKHFKIESFLRQLNIYGFTRLRSVRNVPGESDNKKALEFHHPNFIRGREDLMREIVRNQSTGDKRKGKKTKPVEVEVEEEVKAEVESEDEDIGARSPPSEPVVEPPSPVLEEPEPELELELQAEPEPEPKPEPELEPEPEPEHEPEPEPETEPEPVQPPTPVPPTYEELGGLLAEEQRKNAVLSGHLMVGQQRFGEQRDTVRRLKLFVAKSMRWQDVAEIADLFPRSASTASSSQRPPHLYPPSSSSSAPHSQSSFSLAIPQYQHQQQRGTPSPTLSFYSGTGGGHYNAYPPLNGGSGASPSSGGGPTFSFFQPQQHPPQPPQDVSFSPIKRPRLSPDDELPSISPSERTPTGTHPSLSFVASRPLSRKASSRGSLRVGNVGGSSIAARRRSASASQASSGLEQPSYGVKVVGMDEDLDPMGEALRGVYTQDGEGLHEQRW